MRNLLPYNYFYKYILHTHQRPVYEESKKGIPQYCMFKKTPVVKEMSFKTYFISQPKYYTNVHCT